LALMRTFLFVFFVLSVGCFLEGECKRTRRPGFHRFRDVSTLRKRVANELPVPKTLFFEQPVDHFNFQASNDMWMERYLVADDYWGGKGAPIFFYAGNEGDIWMFYNNTGYMFTLAQEFGALIVFAEHRYYGESMPYGNQSYTADTIGYLTSEQAMADYAMLVSNFKLNKAELSDSRVIVFGGSYGGMLASWIRMRYPNVFHGALAASAPIWDFQGQIARNGEQFATIATRDYALSGPFCAAGIRAGFDMIVKEAERGQSGFDVLTDKFMLCSPIQNDDDVLTLIEFVSNGYIYMAMTDYPSPSDFLQPLPAWPVSVSCQYWNRTTPDLLTSMRLSVGVYYNSTGDQPCFNIDQDISPDLGDAAWDYQACTEMIMPTQSNGKTDMFLPDPWDYDAYVEYCQDTYDVTPRPLWTDVSFWGHELSAASNIIFSNGKLDPWMFGGVTYNISSTVTAIVIEHGAHHLDLRTPNPADPQSVIDARNMEKNIIAKWLSE